MLITLAAFIAGSVIGTWQWHLWRDVPGYAPFILIAELRGTGWDRHQPADLCLGVAGQCLV